MLTIGSDPELFVYENGVLSSAIGKVGGTKENPRNYRGVSLQEDNVLLEFNTKPVGMSTTGSKFRTEVVRALNHVQKFCDVRGMTPRIESSNVFTEENLRAYGPEALEFGCDPDFNAHTSTMNPAPDPNTLMRTAGGHLHVGYNSRNTDAEAEAIIRACDLYLGVPSVMMDQDTERRTIYGRAGAYRKKPYGVEYRSLSNFWLKNHSYMEWAGSQIFRSYREHTFIDARVLNEWELVQECINTSNKDMAQYLIDKYKLEVA